MKQMTLAGATGFEKHSRATRKAAFLARMETLVPWSEFCALVEPYYPKPGNGRPPIGIERMLRDPQFLAEAEKTPNEVRDLAFSRLVQHVESLAFDAAVQMLEDARLTTHSEPLPSSEIHGA